MTKKEKREIVLEKYPVIFTYRKVKRAKHIRIHISSAQKVLVTASPLIPYKVMEVFVMSHKKWIEEKIVQFYNSPIVSHKLLDEEYQERKERARTLVLEKLEFWNQYYGFSWKKVAIRNQKTRWGSYSGSGALSFHAGIVDLPENLQDYLIVHELCHIGELNHGKKFWKLTERSLPNAKKLDSSLKKFVRVAVL